jgi:hypothetical protein
MSYYARVDTILRDNHSTLPFTHEHFAYAMMWKKRGETFTVPLGTVSVLAALHPPQLDEEVETWATKVLFYICLAFSV